MNFLKNIIVIVHWVHWNDIEFFIIRNLFSFGMEQNFLSIQLSGRKGIIE